MASKEELTDEHGLRVFVSGGGCSGLQYGMAFDTARDTDTINAVDGVRVIVDPISLDYLRGRKRWRKPHLVGLAYDFQRIEALPVNDWDVPLTAIVTDNATYHTAQP